MSLYANAVASAKEKEILDESFFTELENSKDFSCALKLLSTTNYDFINRTVENALNFEERKLYNFILSEGDNVIKDLLKTTLDYDNALYALRGILSGNVSNFVPDEMQGNEKFLDILAKIKEGKKLNKNLTLDKDIGEVLTKTHQQLNFLYQKKLSVIKTMSQKSKLKNFVELLIDLENLSILYNSNFDKDLLDMIETVGTISKRDLVGIVREKNSFIDNTCFNNLIKIMKSALNDFVKLKLFREEKEKIIFDFLTRDNSVESQNVFLKYVFKKLFEIKRLRLILLQKKYLF